MIYNDDLTITEVKQCVEKMIGNNSFSFIPDSSINIHSSPLFSYRLV